MKIEKNICVVGAGYWGKNHIRTLYNMGALGGIVEPNSDLLTGLLAKYPGVKIYINLETAISGNNFDGFIVATPAETHYSIAREIIEADKPVLVEKPLTLNIQQAEDLVTLSEKKSVNLMVGHVLLFHPAVRKIKELITNGKIGKLQYIYSNRLNLGQVRTEENVFWSLAPHDISIFQYFTESFPIAVKAHGSIFLQPGIHDSTMMILVYPENVKGHIFVSWLHPFKEHRLVVIGSEGMLSFEDSAKGKPLKYYGKKFELSGKVPEKVDGPVELIEYENKMPLTEELKYFIEHLNEAKPQIANGRHALEVTRILVEASNQLEV